MDEFYVDLGGKRRQLRFDLTDREEIEGLFPRPDGSPASLGVLLRDHLIGPGSFRVQVTILFFGLRFHSKGLTEDQVRSWVQDYLKGEGAKLSDLMIVVAKAIHVSGVLGYVGKLREAAPEEGKEPATVVPGQ